MPGANEIQAAKTLLRKTVAAKLSAIPPASRLKQSGHIRNLLLSHPKYLESQRISIYLSTDEEVDTISIIEDIFKSGKSCFVPRYSKGRDMEMVRLHSMNDLKSLPLTRWNIRQPALDDAREIALETGGIDLVILPGMAFTFCGKRLGHGKGYYDTFLHKCREVSDPATIGLAFREQILPDIPIENHDVILDYVLYSPERISNKS